MVKLRNNMYFSGVTVLLYLLVKYSGIRYDLPGFLAYHLTDLLFIPLQLFICLWGLRVLKRDLELLIPPHLIFLVVVFMSILFEWYVPVIGLGTGDFVDAAMYAAGGFIFHFIQRAL